MNRIKSLILLLACLAQPFHSPAQSDGGRYLLHFRNTTEDPSPNADRVLTEEFRPADPSFQGKFYRIVQFYEIPGAGQKEVLKDAGVELLGYLPQMAWLASIRSDCNLQVLKEAGIRCILPLEPVHKLAPPLYEKNYPAYAMTEDGRLRLTVAYFSGLSPEAVLADLSSKGFTADTEDHFSGLITLTVSPEKIQDLVTLPYISWIEPVSPEPDPENYTGRTLHHANALASDYDAGRHYDGTGVQIMLQDDGVIGPHMDYAGRIGAQYLTNNDGNHGDHCAGILFGAGNIDPKARAHAFGANLWVYSVSPNYPGFNAIPTVYFSPGIRVTSASYGDGCNAGYNSLARKMDQQVRTYPALLHVFSAGNSGTDNCGYGAGAGWGNITGGHKVGKNVIAAANLDYMDNLAGSSSRGPAHDGRIKPDISSKGTDVYSTVDPNNYEVKSGTSMACPAVAGTLAQLVQAYRELYPGNEPPAGLMKAILLNTAEDLGNPGPDFKFGWGRVNALRAVQVIEQGRFDSGIIVQGAADTRMIAVPPNTAQVRVMVYWTDPEALTNSSIALVNNLNITLSDVTGVTWNPWILSYYAHPDSLNKPAYRGVDNRNNMEQVTLDNPASGMYVLHIAGVNVPQGPQNYHVVWEFIPDAVVLTYPIGGESFVPGETETIRWDANPGTTPFDLEWSADNGVTWKPFASGIASGTRYFNWTVPGEVTGGAHIRISRGSSVSQTAAPFSILGVPCDLTVDWVCSNALHLTWSRVPGATGYTVYRLGTKYMEPVGVTSVNSFIVDNLNTSGSVWLSVAAIGPDNMQGRRAVAIEQPAGVVNCYASDAALTGSPTASWGLYQTAMDLSSVHVSVIMKNNSLQPVAQPTFSYRIGNGPVKSAAWTGTVLPDSSLTFVFPEKADISDTGTYWLKAWVDYPPDTHHANDTLEMPFRVTEGGLMSTGTIQNFESWTKCLSAPVCEAYTCPLGNGWTNLANNIYDEHDWRTYSGSTPSSGTGPDSDHTIGNSTGKYLYVEPSLYCVNKSAVMATPCLDLTGSTNPKLMLWYHAYGADIGSFHIDLFDGTDILTDLTLPLEGSKGNEWKKLEQDLTPWAGKKVAMRLRAVTGCKDRGDFAIDDFSITDVVGTQDPLSSAPNHLKIYPNPAGEAITIRLQDARPIPFTLQITDILGQTIRMRQAIPQGRILEMEENLTTLRPGIYLIRLTSTDALYQEKLIKR